MNSIPPRLFSQKANGAINLKWLSSQSENTWFLSYGIEFLAVSVGVLICNCWIDYNMVVVLWLFPQGLWSVIKILKVQLSTSRFWSFNWCVALLIQCESINECLMGCRLYSSFVWWDLDCGNITMLVKKSPVSGEIDAAEEALAIYTMVHVFSCLVYLCCCVAQYGNSRCFKSNRYLIWGRKIPKQSPKQVKKIVIMSRVQSMNRGVWERCKSFGNQIPTVSRWVLILLLNHQNL